jgi:ADP-ribose pyrophosphatase
MSDSKVRSSKTVYTGPAFSVVQDEIEFPNGLIATRDVVQHPGAVVILPLLDPETILFVRQYRHPLRRSILELPAGTLETGELPLACAQREICEEVGYGARDWIEIGDLYPAPGFCDEHQRLFLARKLYEKSLPGDEDEIIEVEAIALVDIPQLVLEQQIVDAKTLALIYRAQLAGYLRTE